MKKSEMAIGVAYISAWVFLPLVMVSPHGIVFGFHFYEGFREGYARKSLKALAHKHKPDFN